MRTRTLTVALVTTIALTAAGCGSSDDSGGKGGNDKAEAVSAAERPYVDALTKSMTESDDDDVQMSDKTAACVAPQFVRIIGVQKLKDNGITPEAFADDDSLDYSKLKITEKDGNALYDTFEQCDFDLRKAMVDSFAADEEMTPAMAKCMEDVLTDDNLR